MILGKDSVVRSFHNVCRHRAFPVARKQSGNATVLGCRYHGWSYDTKGTLIKAPYFDDLPSFDRSQNSLYEINTKQDMNGFVHINVSTLKDAASTHPAEGAKVGKVGKINVNCNLLHTLELEGKFNWKVMRKKFNKFAWPIQKMLRILDLLTAPISKQPGWNIFDRCFGEGRREILFDHGPYPGGRVEVLPPDDSPHHGRETFLVPAYIFT